MVPNSRLQISTHWNLKTGELSGLLGFFPSQHRFDSGAVACLLSTTGFKSCKAYINGLAMTKCHKFLKTVSNYPCWLLSPYEIDGDGDYYCWL